MNLVEVIKTKAAAMPQVEMPTKHFLVDGMYLRQIRIPEGTMFMGRKHKKFHFFLCLAGGAWVESDSGPVNIKAGMVLLCNPGSQRIGITYADTVFATVHRTEETMLKNIEDDCVEFDSGHRYGTGNEILQTLPEAL